MSEFKVGRVVKAKIDLVDFACGDHPTLIYAKAGDELTIVDQSGAESWNVKNNRREEGPFHCREYEIEVYHKEQL